MEDPQVTIGFNTQTVDLDDLGVPSRLRTHTHTFPALSPIASPPPAAATSGAQARV